jgi:hypothetical protein
VSLRAQYVCVCVVCTAAVGLASNNNLLSHVNVDMHVTYTCTHAEGKDGREDDSKAAEMDMDTNNKGSESSKKIKSLEQQSEEEEEDDDDNEYERMRLKRIEENKRIMMMSGILDAKEECHQACSNGECLYLCVLVYVYTCSVCVCVCVCE